MELLLIDDYEIVRVGLKKLFMDTFAHPTYAEASTVEEARRLAGDREWNMAVLELAIEQNSGFHLLEEMKRRKPKLPVLVFTVHSEQHYGVRALRAGAAGYLTKMSGAAELVTAAKQIINGGHYVTTSLAETLSIEVQRNLPEFVHDLLSNRELQILRLLGGGKKGGEIAALLSISDKTVSTYRARILEKTGMKNNAELVRYAVEHGLSNRWCVGLAPTEEISSARQLIPGKLDSIGILLLKTSALRT